MNVQLFRTCIRFSSYVYVLNKKYELALFYFISFITDFFYSFNYFYILVLLINAALLLLHIYPEISVNINKLLCLSSSSLIPLYCTFFPLLFMWFFSQHLYLLFCFSFSHIAQEWNRVCARNYKFIVTVFFIDLFLLCGPNLAPPLPFFF